MLFRLNKGCAEHEQDGKMYNAGDVIKSETDLVKVFSNKFTRLLDTGSPIEGDIPAAPNIPSPNKGAGDADKASSKPSSDKKKERARTIASKTKDKKNPHGKDVSKSFPTAATVELKVYEKNDWYVVVDPDDGVVLTEKKLRKKDVEGFLAGYITTDDNSEYTGIEDSENTGDESEE